jgi:DNA-binding IclR family transcriptional regulator
MTISEPRRVMQAASARGLSTARSVLQVLTLLAEHPEGVSACDVADRVGKSTSTAYYLLASLCEEGYAVHERSGRYRLRASAAPSPPSVAEERCDVEAALDALYRRTRKRCYLGRLRLGAVKIVDVRGRQGLPRVPGLGTRIEPETMHALAMGKVILSRLGPDARERYVRRPLAAFTDATITSADVLLRELDDVRECGVAVDREEFQRDFCCVAAPLVDGAGRFVATIGLSVTARAFDAERDELTAVVREVAGASKHLRKSAEILPLAAASA